MVFDLESFIFTVYSISVGSICVDRVFFRKDTQATGTVLEDRVFGDERVVILQPFSESGNEFFDRGDHFRRDIAVQAAEPEVIVGKTLAGGHLEDVENVFAVVETVKEGSEGAEIE